MRRDATRVADTVSAEGDAQLSIRNITTVFGSGEATVHAVTDVSYDVRRGETVAVVGESGSGKSVTVLSAMGLLPSNGRVIGGSAHFAGRDLLTLSREQLRRIRGSRLAMVFQDPMTSLNPVHSVGDQIVEGILSHTGTGFRRGRAAAWDKAVSLLELVDVPDPAARAKQYPHELSGGMRQRVMIAMAICNEPEILIADEATTALDVTIQAQIMRVLRAVQRELGMGLVLITHDLGLVAQLADRVVVMYAGRVVEQGGVLDLFDQPRHPYTQGLLESLPTLRSDKQLHPIAGQPPDPRAVPPGCAFEPRCALGRGRARCREERPVLHEKPGSDHAAACHFSDELAAAEVPS